jgi:uncharacterized protein
VTTGYFIPLIHQRHPRTIVTELNNIGGILVVNATGTVVTTPALFTVSEYHATYGALSVLVAIPVFWAIAYKVFKRDEASEPASQSDRKERR